MKLEMAYPQEWVPWLVLALVPVACCFWSSVALVVHIVFEVLR